MKKLKFIILLSVVLIFPFLSNAQFVQHGIIVTYSGPSSGGGLGTLRVSNSLGATHDYTTFPSNYNFMGMTGGNTFTLDWNHTFASGWGSRIITISKSTFDAMATGASVTYPSPQDPTHDYYTITKGFGHSVIGITYDYTLTIGFYDDAL